MHKIPLNANWMNKRNECQVSNTKVKEICSSERMGNTLAATTDVDKFEYNK